MKVLGFHSIILRFSVHKQDMESRKSQNPKISQQNVLFVDGIWDIIDNGYPVVLPSRWLSRAAVRSSSFFGLNIKLKDEYFLIESQYNENIFRLVVKSVDDIVLRMIALNIWLYDSDTLILLSETTDRGKVSCCLFE